MRKTLLDDFDCASLGQEPPRHETSHRTRVVKRLSPDQAGALKLARRFGDSLVCVRYRQDPEHRWRYTTVELIVDSGPMPEKKTASALVRVRIGFGEAELRAKAMAHGAQWDNKARLWTMSRATATLLGLTHRIVSSMTRNGNRK